MRDLLNDGCGAQVELLDVMGDDQSIVDMARVCVTGLKPVADNTTLIRYLMRHYHTTPFEGVVTKWRIKAPIFVVRQWFRHRTWSYNEMSQRYAEVPDEIHVPSGDQWRSQAANNKQGSDGTIGATGDYLAEISRGSAKQARDTYECAIGTGNAREQARVVLPMGTYTQFIGVVNLWNLMSFLRLRMHPHAQQEIRVFANAMHHLIEPHVPAAMHAFDDYILNSIAFSRQEQCILQTMFASGNQSIRGYRDEWGLSKRELAEFKQKVGAVFGETWMVRLRERDAQHRWLTDGTCQRCGKMEDQANEPCGD